MLYFSSSYVGYSLGMKFPQIILTFKIIIAVVCSVISTAHADSFPTDYVEKMLAEARRGTVINVGNLAEGEMISVQFVDRPIYIYRRTATDIRSIEQDKTRINLGNTAFRESIRREYGSTSSAAWARLLLSAQKISTTTPTRSLDRRLMVIGGWSPVTGCALRLVPRSNQAVSGSIFHDPCSNTHYDAAGRPLISSTTPNVQLGSFEISVPPYSLDEGNIVLGPAKGQPIPNLPFTREELYGFGTPTQKLIAAAKYNDIEAVSAAIKAGATINYFRSGEGSPIDAAIVGSSIDIIKLLVQEGAKATSNSEVAARFLGREDVVTLLKSIK